jgi:hypothetical protein
MLPKEMRTRGGEMYQITQSCIKLLNNGTKISNLKLEQVTKYQSVVDVQFYSFFNLGAG